MEEFWEQSESIYVSWNYCIVFILYQVQGSKFCTNHSAPKRSIKFHQMPSLHVHFFQDLLTNNSRGPSAVVDLPKVSCCGLAPGCGGWFNQLGSSDSVWSGWDFVGILRGIFWRERYIHAINFVKTNEGIYLIRGFIKVPNFFWVANFRHFQHMSVASFGGLYSSCSRFGGFPRLFFL